ncbi:hypothetical protein NIES4074_51410 [Cylindrospermum sp. NIES-4074]|nr:hypothetical protein NIES4074_51410 [Cylindrospermum sp. NIES-4074]
MFEHLKGAADSLLQAAGNMAENEDAKAIGAISAASSAAAGLGSIAVATVTTSAPGILGVMGFTTTSVVALPAAGVVAVGGLAAYGIYKGVQLAKGDKNSDK